MMLKTGAHVLPSLPYTWRITPRCVKRVSRIVNPG